MNQFWADYGPNLAVLLTLFVMGCGYATLIAWLNVRSFLEGYTALSVVLGVAFTVLIAQLMHTSDPTTDLLWEFGAFVASGAPMIFNNLREHYHRVIDQRAAVRDLHNG